MATYNRKWSPSLSRPTTTTESPPQLPQENVDVFTQELVTDSQTSTTKLMAEVTLHPEPTTSSAVYTTMNSEELNTTGYTESIFNITEINPMSHFGHKDDSDHTVWYIIIGIIVVAIVVVGIVMYVIFNHYKKRNSFSEIKGECAKDPPSMQTIQKSCSEDALLDK